MTRIRAVALTTYSATPDGSAFSLNLRDGEGAVSGRLATCNMHP